MLHYFYGPKDTPMVREDDGTERAANASEILELPSRAPPRGCEIRLDRSRAALESVPAMRRTKLAYDQALSRSHSMRSSG